MRGATDAKKLGDDEIYISTHAPLAGRDRPAFSVETAGKYFNPRAPCGARRRGLLISLLSYQISTHAPLAGRDGGRSAGACAVVISTHAPLAGRDAHRPRGDRRSEISTHAPLAGRDPTISATASSSSDFNPRAPCGARQLGLLAGIKIKDFNPRAPCGARPRAPWQPR